MAAIILRCCFLYFAPFVIMLHISRFESVWKLALTARPFNTANDIISIQFHLFVIELNGIPIDWLFFLIHENNWSLKELYQLNLFCDSFNHKNNSFKTN